MAVSTSNVSVITDSFQNWIDKTNVLLDAYSTTIVTAAPNTAGGLTTGNVNVEGIFRANTIAVSSQLRGGNVTTSGVLTISSNVSIGNSSVNTTITTTTLRTGLNLVVEGTSNLATSLSVGGTATVTGNTTLNGALQTFSGNAVFDSGVLFVDSVGNRVGINNTTPGVALRVTGDVDISATANVQGDFTVGSNAALNGTTTANAMSVSGNLAVTKDMIITGNSYFAGNNFLVTSAGVTVNSAITFSSNTTLQKNVIIQGTSLSINAATQIVASNTDLGSNTTAPQLIMSIPKSTFKGGEVILNATKLNQSQVTKVLFAHDNTNVEMTTYGTVTSPSASAEMVTFTAAINNSNVEFSVQQSSTSTSVKMMATLF